MRKKCEKMDRGDVKSFDVLKICVSAGDIVTRWPITFSGHENKQYQPMKGKVVYVHPRGRFHVVEFPGKLGAVRESFLGVAR